MDHYTAERLFLEHRRRVSEAAERHSRLAPATLPRRPALTWLAASLRSAADRIDGGREPVSAAS